MEESRAWHSRPGVARALRIGIVVAPILITIVLVTIVSRGFPRPEQLTHAIGWWIGISVFATLLLAMVDRIFRRLLPIVALFKISLVFPDSAPSRFSTALRTGTVKQLKRKMASGELETSTPQEAAEQLIGIAAALNAHDRLTRGHTERVRAYSVMIGEEMGLDDHEIELLNWSGLIHDVGKLHVPTEILNKPGRPDDDEWAVLKEHPSHGGELIEPLRDFLGDFAESATQHHEKFDGTGYPLGLAGEEITLAGRIVAVADAYDVMTSTRSYKKPMSAEVAREELARNSGTQFDPEVVRAFLNIALGHLRLVAGPLAGLAQLPLPTAATAGAGSAAATGASAAATIAVATVSGLVDPVPPPEDPPAAVALVDIVAPDLRGNGTEDEPFVLDLQAAVGDLGVVFIIPSDVEGVELAVSPDGVLSVEPEENLNGEIVVPYQACIDGRCEGAEVTIDFAPVNDAPLSAADSAEVAALGTVAIDVLANDLDPDGEMLELTSVSEPASGSVRIVDNRIEFTAGDTDDEITITYSAVDGAGVVVEETLTLVVVRAPVGPTATTDRLTISEDSVARFDPTENDIPGDVALDPTSVRLMGPPASGVARVVNGAIEWVPERDWNGTAGFTYRVCDIDGLCSSASVAVTVTPVNDAPTFDLVAAITVNEDAGPTTMPNFVSNRVAGPPDERGQTIAFSVVADDPSLFSSQPAIDALGTLTFTVAPDVHGSTTLTVIARDSGGDAAGGRDSRTAASTVTVRSVNDLPSADLGVNIALLEDLGPQVRADWVTNVVVGPENESSQTAGFTVATDRDDLFAAVPAISDEGVLTFEPAPDAVGVATLRVTALDSGGASAALGSRTITLLEVNDAPTFAIAGDIVVNEDAGPQTIRAHARDVVAGPTSERAQSVRFDVRNDNAALFSAAPAIDPEGTLTFTSAPNAFGSATVTVDLIDDGGVDVGGVDRTDATFILVVTSDNGTPVAVPDSGGLYATDEDTAFTTGDVLANDFDEEGPLDGSRITIVQDVQHGTLTANGDGTFDYDPDPDFHGTDGFEYRVADADGSTSSPVKVDIDVRPINDAPDAADDGGVGFETAEDTAFTTGSVLGNDSDVESTLDPADVFVVDDPANGVVVHNGDGTFDYTPDGDFAGSDTFTYRVSDDVGEPSNLATVTITVTGENDAPVAVADFGAGWATVEDTPFTTPDVTANDTDVDGTVDPTTVTVVSSPLGGVLTNNGDGTFYYEPNADFAGADAFTYHLLDDGGLQSNTVTVNLVVTGENDPPVAVNDGTDGSIRTNEDTQFTTPSVLANDSDPDGVVNPASVTVTVTSGATDGTLTYNGDGTFDYAPDPDFEGTENIRYTITDVQGATSDEAILRIFVDPVNDRPVGQPDSGVGYTTSEGTLLTTIDVTDNDTDIDSPIDPTSAAIVAMPFNGSLVNNGDGTFDYTPDALYNGSDVFTYTITDDGGLTSDPVTVTLTVTPVNDKPIATDDGGVGFEGVEGAAFTTGDVTVNDTDPEDGTVNSSTVVIVDDPASGSLVNNGDGTFDYTPDADTNGTDTFTYRVADSGGLLSDPATVTLAIAAVNDPPTFTRGPNVSLLMNSGQVSIDDWASDVEPGPANESGQTVTFVLTPADAGFFSEQPAIDAAGRLTFRVADGESGTTTVAVSAVDDGGTANGGVDSTSPVTLEVLVSNDDFDGVAQGVDNAPVLYNPAQIDTDGDGVGDVADPTPTAAGSTGVFSYSGLQSDNALRASDGIAADFDGDGRLDLAVSTEDDGTYVWFNSPMGLDLPAPIHLDSDDEVRAIATADLDGDGDLDLVMGQVGGGNETWINDGAGAFSVDQTLGAFDTHGIALGDVDGDGDVDVVSANTLGNNAVRLNDGTGVFTLSQVFGSSSAKDRAIAMDDVDGDFDLDVVIGTEGADSTVWLNDGTGNFVDSGQALSTGKVRDLVLADFDRDGDVDLVVAADNDDETYWVNQGNGTFVDSGQAFDGGNTHDVAVGDVDGDGDLDLVLGNDHGDTTVWLNDGNEVFADSGQGISSAGKTEAVVLADFTGDGALDIVTVRDNEKSQFYLGGIN